MRQPYRRVVFARSALLAIRAEAKKFLFKETGGALIGYVDESFSAVVVDASGPGPQANHRYSEVRLDGAFITQFCERWRKRSNGVIDYIGDWHTHISSSIRPSATDIEAMRLMAPFTASPSFPPISLIVSRFTQRYGVFVFGDLRLDGVHCDELDDRFIPQLNMK